MPLQMVGSSEELALLPMTEKELMLIRMGPKPKRMVRACLGKRVICWYRLWQI